MSTSSSINLVFSSSSKTLRSKIEKLVFGGAGLFRDNGCVVFVPFAAPGDELTVKVTQAKKDYKIARIENILKPGPDRIKPHCPHYQSCGGCQLQHISPSAQLRIKRGFLEELFGQVPPLASASMSWHYRSHLRFNLEKGAYGFKGCDQKTLVEIDSCPLFLPKDATLFSSLRQHLRSLKESGSFRIFKVSNAFVLAFSFPRQLPRNRRFLSEELMKHLPINGIAMKSPRGEEHIGNTKVTETICGLEMTFSPYGFMQNNPHLISKLYETLVSWAKPAGKTVLDLYCGVGTTSLLLGRAGAKVVGVEESRAAIKCAHINQKRHQIPGVTFLQKKAEEALKTNVKPDLIIVNPPRTGLSKEVREALCTLRPAELIYISCMPSTLKRDMEALDGYDRQKLLGFDLFPQTTHLETLVKMTRKNLN